MLGRGFFNGMHHMARLTVLSYNTLFAGHDTGGSRRAELQARLIQDIKPDVFLMQEAKGFESNGGAWLYTLEQVLGMRGFLALAPRTGQNTAIFIREPLRPMDFEADSSHFHHALATLRVAIPGHSEPLTLMSVHLCPNGAEARLREAAGLCVLAKPNQLTLIGGDFNSASPHDPEPDDWGALAAHHRARYVAQDLEGIDRSVMARLAAAGWVDVERQLIRKAEPTVPTPAYRDAEFATMRCDYLLASAALASKARSYQVVRNSATDEASDHYPILATFEL